MSLTPQQRDLIRRARDEAARARLKTEGYDALGRRKPGAGLRVEKRTLK